MSDFYPEIYTRFDDDSKEIFSDIIFKINIVSNTVKDCGRNYSIDSVEISRPFINPKCKEDIFEKLQQFEKSCNENLKESSKLAYKTGQNTWQLFYLYKEVLQFLSALEFNYYRGQKADWKTVPGIFRDADKNPEYMKDFEKLYKKISREYPEEIVHVEETQYDPRDEGLRKKHLKRANQLALLQHYGMRTSLLDLTENPYIAMLFMLSKDTDIRHPRLEAYKVIEGEEINHNEKNIVTFVEKTKNNKRIIAQKGAFLNFDKLYKISINSIQPIERVIIEMNFSEDKSLGLIEAEITNTKEKYESATEEDGKATYKMSLEFLNSLKKGFIKEDSTVDSNQVTQFKIYKDIQQEMLKKLSEYHYETEDLFPDFENYLKFITSEYSSKPSVSKKTLLNSQFF